MTSACWSLRSVVELGGKDGILPEPAWVPYLEPTIEEANRTTNFGQGLMGSRPKEAATHNKLRLHVNGKDILAISELET